MRIEYTNPKVQALFEDMNLVQTSKNLIAIKTGQEIARSIKKRHNQIEAAPDFKEYIKTGLGKPHALSGDKKGDYAIHLNANYRLIVQPKGSETNMELIDTIIIKGVTDYHGKGKKENWIIP